MPLATDSGPRFPKVARAFVTLAFALTFFASPARSNTMIVYSLGHLGPDHWQYTYNVTSDHVFQMGEFFAIFFDFNTVASIDTPPPVTPGWTPQVFQPDPILMANGELDEIADSNGASLANPFPSVL